MSTSYDIVAGPNKDLLFDACKYAYDKSCKIDVQFSVASGYTTTPDNDPKCAYVLMDISDIMIAGIDHEDGSGDSFNIHGYCRISHKPTAGFLLLPSKFVAYYNVKSRKGKITFPD